MGDRVKDKDDWRNKPRAAQSWIIDYDESGDEWLGWLLNYDVNTVTDESQIVHQVLTGVFFRQDGETFKANIRFKPYFYVVPAEDAVEEVMMGLKSTFSKSLVEVVRVEKEDLDLPNHLSGIKRVLLKLVFYNVQQLMQVRDQLMPAVKRNRRAAETFDFFDEGKQTSGAFMDKITDLREYDVKYHSRLSIDMSIYVGKWYYVSGKEGEVHLRPLTDYLANPSPRVVAFDIETTKAPLKFPQPDIDQIYMISWMLDGQGFLIINREIVTEDIEDFEYTPKPEYEGMFTVYNVENEEALLRKWVEMMKIQKPHVFVTYYGDTFDFPFIQRRMQEYNMYMVDELGFKDSNGEVISPYVSHLDCLYWVNRDSYLPQGSRNLKAVCRKKLGYDPLEIHPEDMLPLAREQPQKMASYSVSDAVATYYLFMKYVQPFIFSLCTIIPMSPDEVLRKGSGTLCEHLLMVMAFEKNVIYPNKQVQEKERFFNGHLLDTETYIGGHVEALQSGVFRYDIPISWNLNPKVYQTLIDRVEEVMKFAIEVENKTSIEDIVDYDKCIEDIKRRLTDLRDKPSRTEVPHILHLDVGAMYPNIILTNRLQPPSMVTEEDCAACCFNSPENRCKRPMKWIWRGEYFVLNKGEFNRLKQQLQTEPVQVKKVDDIQKKMAGKKAWKFNTRKPLFEKKKPGGKKPVEGYRGGGTGYRKGATDKSMRERLEEEERNLGVSGDEAEDDGITRFHSLKEDEQFALLKKRVTDYCRKAYAKIHETKTIDKVATVCQRENNFYVGTVQLFRDRRNQYKAELKKWRRKMEDAMEGVEGAPPLKECKGRMVLYESLQLAHKCILNSFYGYVMRKGSRWYSMEMAAAVTLCGASLITMSRELVDEIGLSLELDTDGIWCCLPGTFPMDYTLKTKKGGKLKVSYPCVMLNKDVDTKYRNTQYQTLVGPGQYETSTECTIFFEVDGPYKAMILPASKEEGKGIKKRYAVFEFDGTLSELKGFELKRRGELQLIKDFQADIFADNSMFLDGSSLEEIYGNVSKVANRCLDILYNRGAELDTDELMEKVTESCSMTRRLEDYPKDQKSLAVTTARRLADFLGPDMVKDKGLTCTYIIARKPEGRVVTERPIPVQIFSAEKSVKIHWLRQWMGDRTIGMDGDVDVRDVLDWDYYIQRLAGAILKIIVIPAAYQKVPNPVPRVEYPDWLRKRVQEQQSKFKQTKLAVERKKREPRKEAVDMEDIVLARGGTKQMKSPAVANGQALLPQPAAPVAGRKRQQQEEVVPYPKEILSKLCTPAFAARPTANAAALCTEWADDFFSHPEFKGWLAYAKSKWHTLGTATQEGKRTNLTATSEPAGSLRSMLHSAQNQLLFSPWEILEVRQLTNDPPSIVRVVALVADSVKYLKVEVPRTVLVNSLTEWPAETILRYKARPASAVLPRRKQKHFLYQLPLTASTADAESDILFNIRCDASVEGVYESHVSSAMRFQILVGSRCSVDKEAYNARVGGGVAPPDLFHVSDLHPEFHPLDSKDGTPYLTKEVSSIFLFQSATETRGVVGVLFPHRKLAYVVFVRPAVKGAQDPNLRWSSLYDEATQESQRQTQMVEEDAPNADAELVREVFGAEPASLAVETKFVGDLTTAQRLVNQELSQDLTVARRTVVLAQSQMSKELLIQTFPAIAPVPIISVPYNRADDAIFSGSLQWTKDFGRRFLFRYLSARPFAAELIRMSRFSGIPVGNLSGDSTVRALDILYSRALSRHAHVLWCSPGGTPDVGIEGVDDDDLALQGALTDLAQPVVVQVGGSYHTWLIELEVLHLEVVAILAEDPGSLSFTDTSILSQFQLLREVVWDFYHQLRRGHLCADHLLTDLTRWLRSPTSLSYEPQLVLFIHSLAKQMFGKLLTRLTKLGCKVVYADFARIVMATPKTTLSECLTFSNYVLIALKDQPMFKHIQIEVLQFWSQYLFLDRDNFAGMKVPGVPTLVSGGLDLSGVDSKELEQQSDVSFRWTIGDRLPPAVRQKLVLFVVEFLMTMSQLRQQAMTEVEGEEGRALLSSKLERIRTKTFEAMQDKLTGYWTERVLKEVHNMRMDTSLKTVETGGHEMDVAVEYTKTLCHVLGQESQLSEAVRHLKTSVLQLCGVTPHSAAAAYVPPDNALLLDDVMCTFCHAVSSVNLLPTGAQVKALEETWLCGGCGQGFSKDLIESKLVSMAGGLITSYQSQDLLCSRCRLPQSYDLQRTCSCGGDWVAADSPPVAKKKLEKLHAAAKMHGFSWLLDSTTALLALA